MSNPCALYGQTARLSLETVAHEYAVLVKRIAHHLLNRLTAHVQLDDLIQSGMIGLLEAAKQFDLSKGASFETYAGIRIRGHMLDEIRKGDWAPRSVHRNTRRISQAMRELENAKGCDPKDSEVAEHLELSLDQYHQMLQDSTSTRIFSLEDVVLQQNSSVEDLSQEHTGPHERLFQLHFQESLSQNIAHLPERERLVLALYYDEGLNLKEIGRVLEVTESRVSQIHSQAMLRLKSKMKEWTHE